MQVDSQETFWMSILCPRISNASPIRYSLVKWLVQGNAENKICWRESKSLQGKIWENFRSHLNNRGSIMIHNWVHWNLKVLYESHVSSLWFISESFMSHSTHMWAYLWVSCEAFMIHMSPFTLDSGINIRVCLLIFGFFLQGLHPYQRE